MIKNRLYNITAGILLLAITMCVPALLSKNNTIKTGEDEFKQSPTLKDAYKNYFPIGAAVTPETDLTSPAKAAFIKDQFSSLTSKKAMQPMWVHPKENVYRWTEADLLVDFAMQNNMKVRGHCLMYNINMPKWFFLDRGKPASKELVLKRMKEHITTEVTRYKGKVYCWDVVNEAVSWYEDEFFMKDDPLYNSVGPEYVEKAFEFARAADPNAKLFYNDGIYSKPKEKKVYALLKQLKSKGIPIDGIGIQCHLGIEGLDADDLQKQIEMYSSLGLEVQITELDMSVYKRTAKMNDVVGLSDRYTNSMADAQTLAFKKVFDICRKNKGTVTGITFWGSADTDDDYLTRKLNKKNYPLLFDRNLKPKKAFYQLVKF